MSDSVGQHRRQPSKAPRPWDSPGKNTRVGCHFHLQCMKVESASEVAQSCPTLATPWTAAYQAPLSMGFSRQKCWSGVPLPSLVFAIADFIIIQNTLQTYLSKTVQDYRQTFSCRCRKKEKITVKKHKHTIICLSVNNTS